MVSPTATLFRFAEHEMPLWLLPKGPLGQAMLVSAGCAVNVRFAPRELEFKVAVIVAVSSVGTPVMLAVN
jgi:hypothetical protein